jgi:DNA-binding transcriptional MerR regulator
VTQTIPDKLYYRIGEVESITEVPAYVLRYWESEFKLLRPKKNPAGQRLYRRRDLDLVLRIKHLLYTERLTLEGAKKRLLAEARGTHQMDLGLKGMTMEDTLRRTRDRLRALRDRLAPERK